MSDGTDASVSTSTDAPVKNTCPPNQRTLDPISLSGVPADLRSTVRDKIMSTHGPVCEAKIEEHGSGSRKSWVLVLTIDLNQIRHQDRVEHYIRCIIDDAEVQIMRAKSTPTHGYYGKPSRQQASHREPAFINTTGRSSA